MTLLIVEFTNLFFTGLLAGLEVAIHYGFHPPTVALEERPQIVLRQGVARRLRWIAPAFFLPTLVSGILVTVLNGGATGLPLRLAGLAAAAVWILVRVVGTVPINAATIEWNPDSPPADWRARIAKAERFHIAGTWAAILAFAFFTAATALRLV